ncbi:MAG: hypothetical protein ACLU6F_01445 [[Ruminococcus] torques]
MRRYLSVDCGGTKTAFLLCRETGELEAACTLGPRQLYGERNRSCAVSIKRRYFADLLSGGNRAK